MGNLIKLSQNQGQRLVNKTIGLCKIEKRCIETDACPVLQV